LPFLLQELAGEFWREERRTGVFVGRKIELNARPQIREHLLARKMNRWALIGRHPSAYRTSCSTEKTPA